MTKRTKKSLTDDTVLSEETFAYDAAGNVTSANGETAQYSLNNRIMVFNGSGVGCDLDGNLTSLLFDGGRMNLTYDSKNRLTSAGGHTYTYDAEDVRIRNLCGEVDTTYAYDTNGRLSRLLMKTTNGVTTKYVYGIGLIGEQTGNSFRYYHFDSRGSTVALTGGTGIVTDTFEYDTYGKLTSHVGNNEVIFGYNGRDGVVTDANGLLYMRARYYSPEMRRFVNADILPGGISEAVTLNRYAYANGNPVSFVDPFGLASVSNHHDRVGDYYPNSTAEEIYLIDELLNSLAGISSSTDANSKKQTDLLLSVWNDDIEGDWGDEKTYREWKLSEVIIPYKQYLADKFSDESFLADTTVGALVNDDLLEAFYNYLHNATLNGPRPNNIGLGLWEKQKAADLKWVDDMFGKSSPIAKLIKKLPYYSVGIDAWLGAYENAKNGESLKETMSDYGIDLVLGGVSIGLSSAGGTFATYIVTTMLGGTTVGSAVPIIGNIAGAVVGTLVGIGVYYFTEVRKYHKCDDKTFSEWLDDAF